MKRYFSVLILVIAVTLTSVVPFEAAIYMKRDKRGTINITNQPDGDDYVLLLESIEARVPDDYEVPTASELSEMVEHASNRHKIPEALIYSVIQVESSGDSTAESHRGAVGLMQLMPSTAEELGVEDVWHPRQNVNGGSEYLARMLARYDGDLTLALAAYNAGPGNVDKYEGIPPFPETRNYVRRVRDFFNELKVKRDTIYTYVDERGIINVTNIK